MKIKITKEEYDALDESIQGLYESDGDNYKLPVEDLDDTSGLKSALEKERETRRLAKDENAKLKDALKGLRKEMDELNDNKSREKGDVEALEESYKQKLAALEKSKQEEMGSVLSVLQRKTVDAEAIRIATELSGDNAHIILPHIKQRLKFEMADGEAHVRVLNEQGQVTADSLDELKNYYFTNDKYAPIVVGSRASGGGAAGAKGSGGAGPKKLSDMNATEQALFAKANPVEFKKMLSAQEGQ